MAEEAKTRVAEFLKGIDRYGPFDTHKTISILFQTHKETYYLFSVRLPWLFFLFRHLIKLIHVFATTIIVFQQTFVAYFFPRFRM